LSTDSGTIIRLPVGDIREIGRVTQGVRLINLRKGEKVSSVERMSAEDIQEAALADEVTDSNDDLFNA